MFELMPFGHNHLFRNDARDMFALMDAFDKEFFRGSRHSASAFRTDISDNGENFLLESELPGFAKENISIDINGDFLVIKASSSSEQKDEKDSNFIHRERRSASYERSFNISGIDVEGIDAKYENGILSVTLPKLKEEKKAQNSIEIK